MSDAHTPSSAHPAGHDMPPRPRTSGRVLVSHALCPYVQRAVIVLAEQDAPFERIDIDLAAKPDWFLRLSPTGATPLLLEDGRPLFESAAICDYLDESAPPARRLHPADAFERARHRAWIQVASTLLDLVWRLYTAADEETLAAHASDLSSRLRRLEATLTSVPRSAPWFDGERFRVVDAAFAPLFRYLDLFEQEAGLDVATGLRAIAAWRGALSERPSVRRAVRTDYPERLRAFIVAQGSAMSRRLMARPSPQPSTSPDTRSTTH